MKKYIIYISLLLSIISCSQDSKEKKDVETAYQSYIYALSNNDGAAAYDLLSDTDVAYYDNILKMARKCNRELLNKQTPIDLYAIFLARLTYSKKELQQLSPKTFFIDQVKNNRIGGNKDLLQAFQIKNVEIYKGKTTSEGPIITANLNGEVEASSPKGFNSPMQIEMSYEHSKWKFYQTQFNVACSQQLEIAISSNKPNGMDNADFLLLGVMKATGINKSNMIDNY